MKIKWNLASKLDGLSSGHFELFHVDINCKISISFTKCNIFLVNIIPEILSLIFKFYLFYSWIGNLEKKKKSGSCGPNPLPYNWEQFSWIFQPEMLQE